jgi:ankyrin repeat protein
MYCSSARGNDGVKEKSSNESALELAKLLIKKDTSWQLTSSASDISKTKPHRYGTSGGDEKGGSGEGLSSSISPKPAEAAGSGEELSSSIYPKPAEAASSGDTPLFIATKFGCIEIVKEILETYPQAVEHIDDDGRTILHVAIKYRQLEVSELVLKQEVAKRWLVRRLDNKGNSILHMAGVKRSDHVYVPEKLRGPALELQYEMLWFEVHFLTHKLAKGQIYGSRVDIYATVQDDIIVFIFNYL